MTMNLGSSSAGNAGILTNVALAGGFLSFMLSGYNPQALNNPAAALVFLRESSVYIRAALTGHGSLQLQPQ